MHAVMAHMTTMKNIMLIFWLTLTMTFAFGAEFQKLHSSGRAKIILTSGSPAGPVELSEFGQSECASKSFCLIWYFYGRAKAEAGIKRMSAGKIFEPVPGLYAIYSKNKAINELICYDPSGNC